MLYEISFNLKFKFDKKNRMFKDQLKVKITYLYFQLFDLPYLENA